MKKKIILIIACFIIVFISCLLFINISDDENIIVPILDVTYQAKDKNACLTFFKDGKYEMYDCDSEPTNYSFDSENECTYEYDSKNQEINFDCKKSVSENPNVSIKVLKWTAKEFVFEYKNKEITFYEFFDRQFLLPLNKVYKNGRDELELNDDGTFKLKTCDKKCINYEGVADHTDNLITFYFTYKKEDDKKIEYNKIVDAEVTYDYEVKLENKVYKLK